MYFRDAYHQFCIWITNKKKLRIRKQLN
jgi:hypothetical protein